MYQCLKLRKFTKDEKTFWLTKFLDPERAEVFTVYTHNAPPFEVGVLYELCLMPNFKGFNFLDNEK